MGNNTSNDNKNDKSGYGNVPEDNDKPSESKDIQTPYGLISRQLKSATDECERLTGVTQRLQKERLDLASDVISRTELLEEAAREVKRFERLIKTYKAVIIKEKANVAELKIRLDYEVKDRGVWRNKYEDLNRRTSSLLKESTESWWGSLWGIREKCQTKKGPTDRQTDGQPTNNESGVEDAEDDSAEPMVNVVYHIEPSGQPPEPIEYPLESMHG